MKSIGDKKSRLVLWAMLFLAILIALLLFTYFLYLPLTNILTRIEAGGSSSSPIPPLSTTTVVPVSTFIINEPIYQATQVTPIAEQHSQFPIINPGPFLHPKGIFEITPPDAEQSVNSDDWSVTYLDDYSATLYHTISNITITIQATNTGYELDPEAREEFVSAREKKLFGDNPGYFIVDQYTSREAEIVTETITNSVEVNSMGITIPVTSPITITVPYTTTILTTKTVLDNGIPKLVASRYWQFGKIIYAVDIWMDKDLKGNYLDQVEAITKNMKFYPDVASILPIYGYSYLESDPKGIVQMSVPAGWTKETLNDTYTYAVTYYSPDRHAAIQLITYDDGSAISKSVAGSLTLLLLNSYMTPDVMVTEDLVRPNGIEQLSWHSPRYDPNFIGTSSFESLGGTTYMLYSVLYDMPYESLYFDILERSLNSYTILCEGDCEATYP
jgi:hypothetical protein